MLNVDLHQLSEPPARLLALFTEAHASDKWAEGKARLFGWLGGLGLLFGIVGAILGAAAGAVGVVAGVLVLVGGIVSLVIRSRYKRYDLDDRKLATVTQFLKIISADSPQGEPISVRLDLRPHDKATQPAVEDAGWGKPKVKKYQHTWLHLAGSLLDGNRYEVIVTDQILRKEKPKRKYTKVKERTSSQLFFTLRLHTRYGAAEALAGELGRQPLPAELEARTIRGRGRALTVACVGSPTVTLSARGGRQVLQAGHVVTGNTLLGLLLWCYDGLARGGQRSAA